MASYTKSNYARLAGMAAMPLLALAVTAQQTSTLKVDGLAGHANVVQVRGQNYVEVEGLARMLNGSIRFDGSQIVLAIPGLAAGGNSSSAPTEGLSRHFLSAGIEAMSQVREWHSALKNAIELSIPLNDTWLGAFVRQAQQNLRLAEVAASSDADRSAFQLMQNEFNNMKALNDKYLGMAKDLTYIDPNSLKNDPLDQKLVACGHSLASMAGSGQFSDDPACH